MYYICIENDAIVNILNYEPNVPGSVDVVAINDQDYNNIINKTHYFDISTKKIISHTTEYFENIEKIDQKESLNKDLKKFLSDTDWKVLRHIRQKALKIPTSLTEKEYIALENERQVAASQIS